MKSLINVIKEQTLSPRNDGMLHFSSHLNHNRHTALYWWYGYPPYQAQPWANTLPLLQGTSIHEQLHRLMEEHHKPYASEISILAEDEGFTYPWTGTVDAYTEDEDGRVWLLDYKTISGASLTFLDGPKKEHIMQVSAYYHYGMPNVDKVGILYLPTSQDYKRQWHEPIFYEVQPWPRNVLDSHIRAVETDILIYESTRMLPPAPQGDFRWKQNKRNKCWELHYRPHYATMYCPWKHLDDDPCGCSKIKATMVGTYKDGEIDGDIATVEEYLAECPGIPKEV